MDLSQAEAVMDLIHAQSERALAHNTLLAYGRDLDHYAEWIAGGGLADYLVPSIRDLSHYLSFLRDLQLAPPTVARRAASRGIPPRP